jgi:hypothetical protein
LITSAFVLRNRNMECDNGIWSFEDSGDRIRGGPVGAPRGYLACSRKCLSQHVYNGSSEDEKELLRVLARSSNEVFLKVAGRRPDSTRPSSAVLPV